MLTIMRVYMRKQTFRAKGTPWNFECLLVIDEVISDLPQIG